MTETLAERFFTCDKVKYGIYAGGESGYAVIIHDADPDETADMCDHI